MRGGAVRRTSGAAVRRRIAALDPVTDGPEVSRLSLVVLHGHGALVYALFTVAFLEQVATPAMARVLHRRGTGDIVRDTLRRNDDTIVFFGRLLDHGPGSEVGRAWIERMNEIHAHFPIRDQDSLYTLATLALDPHDLTAALGASPFSERERAAHWTFWRAVAQGQRIPGVPAAREELAAWARDYEGREQRPSPEGRAVAEALVAAFSARCLPRPLRRLGPRVLAAFCPPRLRRIHDLPEPGPLVGGVVRLGLRAYTWTLPLHRVDPGRSLAVDFGDRRHGPREPHEVGYQRPGRRAGHGTRARGGDGRASA